MSRALRAAMTAPRQVLPGTTSLVTRRCSERRFFLRPSPAINEMFLYVLALAARRYGVEVHAFCVLSNHFHLVVSDPFACLPEFVRYLDSLVARAANASLGRFEGFWASGTSFSAVAPVAPDDVVAKTAYTLANPVAAGLVQSGAEWPGLWSGPDQIGSGKLTVRRPGRSSSAPTAICQSSSISSSRHRLASPRWESSGPASRTRSVDSRKKIRREVAEARRGFLGVAKVLAQKPTARPVPGEPRFGINPRVAAQDKWKRIEALTTLTDFLVRTARPGTPYERA